jgi:predicted double-glycine peptidase
MPDRLSSRRTWLRAGAASVATLALAACNRTLASTNVATGPGGATISPLTTTASAMASRTAALSAASTAATSAPAVKAGSATVAAVSLGSANTAATSIAPDLHAGLAAPAVAPSGVLAAAPAAATPSPRLRPTAVPVVVARSVPVAATPAWASLGPLEHIAQTLNNCGPASVAEVLNYWGVNRSQGQVQAFLRPDGNPNGMLPYGVPSYARSLGFGAILGTAGSRALIKALVASGIPPIVNQWVSLTDHVAHYRPIEGFDDRSGVFVSSDPFLGAGHEIDYATFDRIWATNSGRFILLYPLAKQAAVQAALGSAGWNKVTAYQNDLAKLQQRLAQHRSSGDGGSQYWQGHGALAVAWDNLELGQIAAARTALAGAKAQHANAVIVDWIAQEIATVTA